MANTFDWLEIRTTDLAKAASFYANVFGWRVVQEVDAEGQGYWIFDSGGNPRLENLRRGGLWLRPRGEDLGVVAYVLVEDIDATMEKIVALGGTVVTSKRPQGPNLRACFRDPSGNLLGLWQEPQAR